MVINALKKLSQVTVATLGMAVLAAVSSAPAQAVNLQTFELSGQFVSEAIAPTYLGGGTLNFGIPPFGLPVGLQNGSFDGTYTVDLDILQSLGDAEFDSFHLNLRDSANNIIFTLNPANRYGRVINNQIFFFDNIFIGTNNSLIPYNFFTLVFDSPLAQAEIATGLVGVYSAFSLESLSYGSIYTTSFTSEPVVVPEPVSVVGIGLAGSTVLFLKRKQQKIAQAI